MAIITPSGAGNWSSTGTWNGGVVPGAGDIVYFDGKIVTLDQDITVAELHNDDDGGTYTSGGYLNSQDLTTVHNVTVTERIEQGDTTTTNHNCVKGVYGLNVTVKDIYGPSSGGTQFAVNLAYGCTLDVTGSIFLQGGNQHAVNATNSLVRANMLDRNGQSGSTYYCLFGAGGIFIVDSIPDGMGISTGMLAFINSVTGGSAANQLGTNNVTVQIIESATGGSGSNADGCVCAINRYLRCGTATQGSGSSAHGIDQNGGVVIAREAVGTSSGSYGIDYSSVGLLSVETETGSFAVNDLGTGPMNNSAPEALWDEIVSDEIISEWAGGGGGGGRAMPEIIRSSGLVRQ